MWRYVFSVLFKDYAKCSSGFRKDALATRDAERLANVRGMSLHVMADAIRGIRVIIPEGLILGCLTNVHHGAFGPGAGEVR